MLNYTLISVPDRRVSLTLRGLNRRWIQAHTHDAHCLRCPRPAQLPQIASLRGRGIFATTMDVT